MCNHLDDDISDLLGSTARTVEVPASARPVDELARVQQVRMHEETCRKCNGSGRFVGYTGRVLGDCFACKGKGKLFYRTSIEKRERAREAAAVRKDSKVAQTATAALKWAQEHADDHAWMVAKAAKFEFAASMLEALLKYGTLTERQHATVTRLRVADAERQVQYAAERQAREASAPTADVSRILTALETAKQNGLKWPKLRLAGFSFSLAGDNSKNAGAVYVKDGDTYLGKVLEGRFSRSRDCDETVGAAILAAAQDPNAAATAYGHLTGNCACCGRELTNPESVARGIGPICAERFGF